ncbi:hypothetical protein BJV78DRAFT_1243176, partial [Lactifluus subvellereus]
MHDAFLRRGRDASHGTRDAQSTARLVDTPRRSHESAGPIRIALAPDSKATPLLPPHTLNLNVSRGSRRYLLNSERSMTPGNDPELALLYMAQRVQVT